VGNVAHRLETIARWWTQATQAQRYECYGRAVHGDEEVPPLETLQLAIYLAEIESGEVGEG
jgi:hypothetical protein